MEFYTKIKKIKAIQYNGNNIEDILKFSDSILSSKISSMSTEDNIVHILTVKSKCGRTVYKQLSLTNWVVMKDNGYISIVRDEYFKEKYQSINEKIPHIILIAAFRYYMGRRTITVHSFIDWLVDDYGLSLINENDLIQMKKEIIDNKKVGLLGDDCDIEKWQYLINKIEEYLIGE